MPHEFVHRFGEDNRSVRETLFRACVNISSVARSPTVCGPQRLQSCCWLLKEHTWVLTSVTYVSLRVKVKHRSIFCKRKLKIFRNTLEKAMATHSSTLAWKIPWTEEPGRLQSMGSRRVGQDWATSLSLFTFMHWRRKWQPTPVFLPGESQGQGSLVGCDLWGRTESDTTEAT